MKRFQILKPTPEQEEYVKNLAIAERLYFQNKNTRNTKYYERYYSYLGETIICDILGQPRPKMKGDDGGHDILLNEQKADVKVQKTNVFPSGEHAVKVYSYQLERKKDDEYLLFLGYDQKLNIFYVYGVMSSLGFVNVAKLHKVGDRVQNCYTINNVAEEQYVAQIRDLAACELPA